MMNLNKYRDEAYKMAKQHGFHDEPHSVEHLKCLIISELMEAVEADRKGKHADFRAFDVRLCVGRGSKDVTVSYDYNFRLCIKDTVEDELADACIRIFDLAGAKNIDLDFEVEQTPGILPNGTFTENVYRTIHTLVGCEFLNRCLALTLVRIFSIAEKMNIDIEWHIRLKMEYNNSRPYKHGKRY